MNREDRMNTARLACILGRLRPHAADGAVALAVLDLERIGTSLRSLAVHGCNVGNTLAQEKRFDRLVDKARDVLEPYGITRNHVDGSGDPRGCVLKVRLPGNQYNNLGVDWGI